jgi:hypothetical protein
MATPKQRPLKLSTPVKLKIQEMYNNKESEVTIVFQVMKMTSFDKVGALLAVRQVLGKVKGL